MTRHTAFALATAATSTAIYMSVLAGWQRGGSSPERFVWVAIGVVLVAGTHLLPALCRSAPIGGRMIGAALWLGCMAATSYGHATFFLLSQQHAGLLREASVPMVSVPAHRSLTEVMTDRSTVTAQLSRLEARPCAGDCPGWRSRHQALVAKVDALEAEALDVRRYQTIDDGNAKRRVTAHDDPVTARLAGLSGIGEAQLDLAAGLGFAAVLEGLACLLWWIALAPVTIRPVGTTGHPRARRTVSPPTAVTLPRHAVTPPPAQPSRHRNADDIEQLRRDIDSGAVKPTVTGIRRHLGCSQAKASALRRQLVKPTASA
ncbi:hypothetical protein [Burkholderia gladioli]|uniref:hypothetical protein n=1 Tax=Burkholderia gladioli TaxID=28095 RepID=UPI002FE29D7E